MIKKIVLLLLLCNWAYSQVPDDSYLRKLSELVRYRNIYIAIPIQNKDIKKDIIIITNHSLYGVYLKSPYTKERYDNYIKSLLNGDIDLKLEQLEKHYYSKVSKKKLKIFNDYKKGLRFVLKNYTDKLGDRFRNKVIDDETKDGLIQIMFNNGYIVSFDDYSGFYYFKK